MLKRFRWLHFGGNGSDGAAFRLAKSQVVQQRINAGGSDIGIAGNIGGEIELGAGIVTLVAAMLEEVAGGAKARASHIGIGGLVPCLIEQAAPGNQPDVQFFGVGRFHRAVFGLAEEHVVLQRIHAGARHILVAAEVIGAVETWRRRPAPGGAGAEIVQGRRHTRLGDIGVLGRVPFGIKQRTLGNDPGNGGFAAGGVNGQRRGLGCRLQNAVLAS